MVEIKARAEAIGLTLGQLARDAKVAPSTPYRGIKDGTDPRRSTLFKLVNALEAREAACRKHLLGLSGSAHGHDLEGAGA
jgi:DNA-binding phage protein